MILNGSILNATTFSPLSSDRTVITTDYLLKLCGLMDTQAYYAAYVGLGISLLAILYFGRLRRWLENKAKETGKHTWLVPLLDKFFLTLIGMTFAFIIARLERGD